MKTVTVVVGRMNQITLMTEVGVGVAEEVDVAITVMMMQADHPLPIETIAAVVVVDATEIDLAHPPQIVTEINTTEGAIVRGHVQDRDLLIAKRGIVTHDAPLPEDLIPITG